MKKKVSLLAVLLLICAMTVSVFSYAYDSTEKHLVYKTLDDFARATAVTTADGLTATATGDVTITDSSLEVKYGADGLENLYRTGSSRAQSKDYLAIQYNASAGVLPKHIQLELGGSTLTQTFKNLAEVKGPEETVIAINGDGEKHVLLIDLKTFFAAGTDFGSIENLGVSMLADTELAEEQTVTFFMFYWTADPASQGFATGDAVRENFVNPIADNYWGGDAMKGTLNAKGLKLDFSAAAVSYQVVSDTKGNIAQKYSFGAFKTFAAADGSGLEESIAIKGITATGETQVKKFSELEVLSGDTVLTKAEKTFVFDLTASFGTKELKGFKIENVSEATAGIVYFTAIQFSEYDYAPDKASGAIKLDEKNKLAYGFMDYDETTNTAGSSLNWAYSRNVTLDKTNKKMIMSVTKDYVPGDLNQMWYQTSPKENNEEGLYKYLVIDLKGTGNAADYLQMAILDTSNIENFLYFTNFFVAGGGKAAITNNVSRMVIDLKANSLSSLGFFRSGEKANAVKFRMAGGQEDITVEVSDMFFANEYVEPEPPAPVPTPTKKGCKGEASSMAVVAVIGLGVIFTKKMFA